MNSPKHRAQRINFLHHNYCLIFLLVSILFRVFFGLGFVDVVFRFYIGEVAPPALYDEYQSRVDDPKTQRTVRNYLAKLVAGIRYAGVRAVERHSRAVTFDRRFRATFVVLAVGVAWEILEFASGGVASVVGGEAVLAQYSTADIVNDLVFNAVGTVLVAASSTAHFEEVTDQLGDWFSVAVRSGE